MSASDPISHVVVWRTHSCVQRSHSCEREIHSRQFAPPSGGFMGKSIGCSLSFDRPADAQLRQMRRYSIRVQAASQAVLRDNIGADDDRGREAHPNPSALISSAPCGFMRMLSLHYAAPTRPEPPRMPRPDEGAGSGSASASGRNSSNGEWRRRCPRGARPRPHHIAPWRGASLRRP